MKGYVVLRVEAQDLLATAHEVEGWALAWLDKHPDDDYQLGYAVTRDGAPIVLLDWTPQERPEIEGGETL